MKSTIPPPYVSMISYAIFIDHVHDETLAKQLNELGFTRKKDTDNEEYRMNPAPDNFTDLAKIVSVLREMGLCFSAGIDWCPSAVVAELKKDGYMKGEFKEIAWAGPGDFIIREI